MKSYSDSASLREKFMKKCPTTQLVDHAYLISKFKNTNWQWYEPHENRAPVNFFRDTSLHGLQYLGQRKRHLFERVFWSIAFILALVTSAILIWHMWDNYTSTPIITVFSPTETTLDKIPFPSVTICSVNNIKKSKYNEYYSLAKIGLKGEVSNETLLRTLANLADISHICKSAKTFAQKFYNYKDEDDEVVNAVKKYHDDYYKFQDPTQTLRNASQKCEEMILFCLWLDNVRNCSELFHQIETDYGFCCVFNMMPPSVLRTFVNDNIDDPKLVKEWQDADLHADNLILEEKHGNRKYPYRQEYAGRSAGLSFLVDPNMEEYHCTNTDSDGFVVSLNVPLDFPRVNDNGIAVRTGTEAFINARPEITFSADSARKAPFEKRHCYFRGEYELAFYNKYTASNCLDECIANKTLDECGCLRYYMPRSKYYKNQTYIACFPWEYNCTERLKAEMIKGGLESSCDNCWPSCSEISFHKEVTSLRIRDSHVYELLKYCPNTSLTIERAKHASIIHVFYNVDSVFPRLRKEMSTIIDLISNAGGLLGLCMGFSMLSLLEIIYHATIRLWCHAYRERCEATNFQRMEEIDSKKRTSFLTKIFSRVSPIPHDQSLVKQNGGNGHEQIESTLPEYFRTAFQNDFQRAFIATRRNPPTQLIDLDKELIY